MRQFITFTRKFAGKDRAQRRDLVRAVWYLLVARVLHVLTPTQRLIADLERPSSPARFARSNPSRQRSGEVAWALQVAAPRCLWRSDCLIQSIAAVRWLRSEGFAPEFKLGVAAAPEGRFAAHAWVELNGEAFLGMGPAGYEPFPAHQSSQVPQ